ncbi:MAG: MATE family efflux transporter [Lachnospiraceae bacterium]|nr:MATE family efflux transporter [Lachnospiraceae bacterium]
MCQFAIPSCVSLVVNALYNIVDQVFIGNGVGYLGNAATTVIMPIMMIGLGVSRLFGDGCAAYYSQELGRKNKENAAQAVGNATLWMIFAGVALIVVFNLILGPFCRLAGATDAIYPYAMEYGRVIVMGMPMMALLAGLSSIIRADGSPTYSMVGLLAGCVTNIVLDYIMVFPLQMGVRGAAIATVIGQLVNTVLYVIYFFRFKQIRFTKHSFRLNGKIMGRICQLGVSSLIIQMSIVVIQIVNNRLLGYFGALSKYGSDIPIAAFGVTMKVYNILISIMNGIAAGALPIMGFNYGAGNLERVRKTTRGAVMAAMISGVICTFFFQLIPAQILSIFGTETATYTEFGVLCLRIFLMLCILDGMNNVVPICYQAVGRPGIAAMASSMRLMVFTIPAGIIMAFLIGVVGVLWEGPIAAAAAFILNIFLLRKIFRDLRRELGDASNTT